MNQMRGASREAFAAARTALDTALGSDDGRLLSSNLFAVSRLLDGTAGLRRALTDPARDGASKADLVRNLLGSRLSASAVSLAETLVSSRWSSPSDLSLAVEYLAVEAEAAAAERDGTLDAVEDQLFRFGRIVAGDNNLRHALTDRAIPAEQKQALVAQLLDGKAVPTTVTLVTALVTAPRGRSIERGLADFAKIASDRRNRAIAHVRTASALTEEQKERLASALAAQVGRPVHLNVEIDPTVLGGMSVRLGEELFDGTISNRLQEARRRIAG
jgi:F-type H+-transporting ATPase subunit delta